MSFDALTNFGRRQVSRQVRTMNLPSGKRGVATEARQPKTALPGIMQSGIVHLLTRVAARTYWRVARRCFSCGKSHLSYIFERRQNVLAECLNKAELSPSDLMEVDFRKPHSAYSASKALC
jgi:hypothetical protein